MALSNIKLSIATATNRESKTWKNKSVTWGDFVKKVSATHRTHEKYAVYCASSRKIQTEIKDVGGFVGGYLAGGQRKKNTVLHRQLITLDVDNTTTNIWDDFALKFSFAACCYSTHKHCAAAPRLRLIIPVDRELAVDEYEAVARMVAGSIGIEAFDPTTFEPSRLMYWPSTALDGEWFFEEQKGAWLVADEVLAQYVDWKDTSAWPISEKFGTVVKNMATKQGDPIEKPGVIGAFCRSYSVHEAIETFLSDVYELSDVEDRYTYKGGSTAAGLVVYEDKFAYSHHGTDPTSMQLCNAFDLVRIHKFGQLDEDSQITQNNKKPSYLSMLDFAGKDGPVRKLIGQEKLAEAEYDFADDLEESDEPVDTDWLTTLAVDKKGNYLGTADNMVKILTNDPKLKGRIRLNTFEQREDVIGDLPWRKVTPLTQYLNDRDVNMLQHYLEQVYDISNAGKLEIALSVILERNQYHPVKDYLNSLSWDGESRVDTLLHDYLGCADSEYTTAIMRKTLCAAIARVYTPGCKFDYALTFVGAQGLKKSMLVDKLGGKWFSDSFTTIKGKEAYEQLQGSWLIEMAELSGLSTSGIDMQKHFISKRKDKFRVAYGRRIDEFPRQCVFFATTNILFFLKDKTGNRRWWPALVHVCEPKHDVADINEYTRGQIWAEAMEMHKAGEDLYLTPELEEIAKAIQENHTEVDERSGIVAKYLDTPICDQWDNMDIYERRGWIQGSWKDFDGDLYYRTKVCAVEIFCEAFNGKLEEVLPTATRDIHDIMAGMPEWVRSPSKLTFKKYGVLKGYTRPAKTFENTNLLSVYKDFEDELPLN